jgi:hypothetical protein
MTRLLATATLVALVATAASALTLALSGGASAQDLPVEPVPVPPPPVVVDPAAVAPGVPHQVTLRVGDTMLVEDAGVGCQVILRNERVAIECRRSGDVRGTYMSVMSKRGVKLARFRSAEVAKVIVNARHGGAWRACGAKARVARAGGRMCR